MTADEPFFLFLATTVPDAPSSKLKAVRVAYRQKRLDSSPENWGQIIELLQSPSVLGAIGKVSGHVWQLMASDGIYEDLMEKLCVALASVRHVLFVHESLMRAEAERPEIAEEDIDPDESLVGYWQREHFVSATPAEREKILAVFERHSINFLPYETNAELSVLASAFVDDNARHLLFRIYVPSGRLYAAEAEKLLSMFRDWLTSVRKQSVRQDGYRTAYGQVYELYGDTDGQQSDLSTEFIDFTRFLDQCADSTDKAVSSLTDLGVDATTATEMVTRYARDVRRLRLDLRQSREMRLLALRHQLESELVDAVPLAGRVWEDVARLVESFVPPIGDAVPALAQGVRSGPPLQPINLNVTQQVINHVEGTVVQNVQGNTNLGPTAQELMRLLEDQAGDELVSLQSALHELEDPDARPADRLGARQRLKAFLYKLGGKVEDSVLAAFLAYIETKFSS